MGEGFLAALSPDGKWVVENGPAHRLTLMPAGPGSSRPIDLGGVVPTGRVGFFPDGKRIFCVGSEKGGARRLYVHDLQTGATRPIGPEDVRRPVISRDGRFVCGRPAGDDFYLYPTEPGEVKKVQGLQRGEEPTQWTEDGLLYVRGYDEPSGAEGLITAKVYRLDPFTGRRELWKEIPPVSSLAGGAFGNILFSADGKICVYTHHRYSSDLFLIDGLR